MLTRNTARFPISVSITNLHHDTQPVAQRHDPLQQRHNLPQVHERLQQCRIHKLPVGPFGTSKVPGSLHRVKQTAIPPLYNVCLHVNLQVCHHMRHVVPQVPQREHARPGGGVPGPQQSQRAQRVLQCHLQALEAQQVLKQHVVLGHHLIGDGITWWVESDMCLVKGEPTSGVSSRCRGQSRR